MKLLCITNIANKNEKASNKERKKEREEKKEGRKMFEA
jgi:hypothetical protein